MTSAKDPFLRCTLGRVVLSILGLLLVLMGYVSTKVATIDTSQSDMRERVKAVEVNVKWLCLINGADVAKLDEKKDSKSN